MPISEKVKFRAFVCILILSGVAIFVLESSHSIADRMKQRVVLDPPIVEVDHAEAQPTADTDEADDHDHILREVRIAVPFATQAPLANWDALHEEACEEASLILVHHYLTKMSVNPDLMEKDIQELVNVEETKFHYSPDVTIAELSKVAREHFGYETEIRTDFSIDDMKHILSQGYPIIVPLAGRRIGNPYYSGEGPWYHMLVITGFTDTQFITNDVGTRRGEGYRYDFQRLYDNIHDWTGIKEQIETGPKAILIVKKKG